MAGETLISTFEEYLSAFWLGSISIIVFSFLQYFVFYDAIIFVSSFTNTNIQKSKKVAEKKSVIKEVVKTKGPTKIETKKTPVSEPEVQITEQKDFLDLLDQKIDESADVSKEYLEDLSNNLEVKLDEFGIEGKVEDSFPGPVITRFEISLAPGTKANQVTNIANDLALSCQSGLPS